MRKMSGTREELENELKAISKKTNVYFQPPEGFNLSYPCFIYNFSGLDVKRADNGPYQMKNRYAVTYMTTDPEKGMSMVRKVLGRFAHVSFDRPYDTDGIYHYVFDIYF